MGKARARLFSLLLFFLLLPISPAPIFSCSHKSARLRNRIGRKIFAERPSPRYSTGKS